MKVQIRLNTRSDAEANINIFMDDEDASRLATATVAASSVAASVFWNVDRSARFNFLELLWATAPSCLPFVEFQYCDAEVRDATDPENGALFEQLWMNVFRCYGNRDYWIGYLLAVDDDGMGARRFLRWITDGRWKLRMEFEQSAADLVIGADRELGEQQLRERMQQILCSMPLAELSRLAKSLPRLQTHRRIVQLNDDQFRHHRQIVQLNDDQVRHCLHAISRTIRLERVMARLRMAAQDVDDPCQSDALWKQMACELNFAISTANWFNRQLHNPFNNVTQSRAKLYRDRHEGVDRLRRFSIYAHNLNLQLGAGLERDEFLERSALERPEALRLIDIEATCGSISEVEGGVVQLVEYEDGMGFSAISHTYGMDVYQMFDCQCCTASWVVQSKGRPRIGPCPHHGSVSGELKQKRDRVVGDMVRMCGWLKEAGVRYAWHDGVCIAQHDEEEVKASIQRMGWVYAYAEETVVFLHYVGTPMAILRNVDLMVDWDLYGLTPRWQMRAWTFQETVLSAKRRYCIRIGSALCGEINSLEEFERMVDGWYHDETSRIQVVEESTFMEIVWETYSALQACAHISWSDLATEHHRQGMDDPGRVLLYPKICSYLKTFMWADGLWGFRCTLRSTSSRSRFWTTAATLEAISNRESKHVGDRINCILALAGVKGFIVPKNFKDPKDGSMDDWTLKFFGMQDQKRLEAALYAVNYRSARNQKRSWAPSLERHLTSPSHGHFQGRFHANKQYLEYKVLPDGKLQVIGDMVCVKANFRVNNAGRVKFSVSTFGGGDHDWAAPVVSADDPRLVSSSDLSAAVLRARIDDMSRCYFRIIGGGDQTTGTDSPPPPFSPDSALSAFRQYVLSLGPDSQQHSPASNSAADLWRSYVDIVCAEAMHTMFIDNFGTAEPVHGWSVLEGIGCHQEAAAGSGISMELRPGMEQCFEATWGANAECRFGKLVCPYIGDEGRHAFSAYLVVPLLCHIQMREWPMLMVEGDLTESGCAVDKIGVMEPSKLFRACFHHFVNTQPGNIIHLANLLIN